MNLFNDNNNLIKTAISYFNNLTDEEKALIVSDLNPHTFKLKRHFKQLFPLLSNIQRALSKHDGIKIGNSLVDLGLEETYARLLVNNMKKHAPTIQYQLGELNKISDDEFIANIEKVMNSIWVDHDKLNKIIEKYNIDHDKYASIMNVSSHMLISLLRGDTTEKQIFSIFTKNGLSEKKSEAFLRSIGSHKERWKDTMMFSDVQDTFSEVEELKSQNKEIIKNMKEILNLLKTKSR